MKKIINNEGKTLQVTESIYDELKSQYMDNVWMAMVKVDGQTHMIPLHENFWNA